MKAQSVMQLEPRERGHSAVVQAKNGGKVPGVVYGLDGSSAPVQVALVALRSAIAAGGEHQPFTAQFRGQTMMVVLRGVQRDLYTSLPVHFDLMPVSLDEPITVGVPVRFFGEPELHSRGLALHVEAHSLTLHGKPSDLPEHVAVEVGQLKPGATVTVGDLKLPPGVTVHEKPGVVVVHVAHYRVRTEVETTV